MRTMQKGGLCAACGKESDDGAYWRTRAVVLNFEIPGVAPREPDMTEPVRCDRCEVMLRLERDYADSPVFAQRVHGGATLADAIKIYKREGWL